MTNIPCFIYGNTRNHNSNFITIWNIIPEDSYIKSIDFDSFDAYIQKYGTKNNSGISNTHQQKGMYADFGYTCGQSLTRKHNINGVSEPILKMELKIYHIYLELVHLLSII